MIVWFADSFFQLHGHQFCFFVLHSWYPNICELVSAATARVLAGLQPGKSRKSRCSNLMYFFGEWSKEPHLSIICSACHVTVAQLTCSSIIFPQTHFDMTLSQNFEQDSTTDSWNVDLSIWKASQMITKRASTNITKQLERLYKCFKHNKEL